MAQTIRKCVCGWLLPASAYLGDLSPELEAALLAARGLKLMVVCPACGAEVLCERGEQDAALEAPSDDMN